MQHFSKTHEEPDNSVTVTFEQTTVQPPLNAIVSVALFCGVNGAIAMARHPAGWDLPSTLRHDDEEPETTAYRLAEEMGIDVTQPQLIGQWVAKKDFDSPMNEKLPEVSYQLLYVSDVTHEGEFTPTAELQERRFVHERELPQLHHDFDNFKDIFEYALTRYNAIP